MHFWLLLILCCSACTPPSSPTQKEPEAPLGSWNLGVSRRGNFSVSWRSASGNIPLNEYFTLEVQLADAHSGAPIEGAQVFVRCDMPAHGHGMTVEPSSIEVGGGLYRVDGMLLHMVGEWVLGIDVVVDGRAESATFPLSLSQE